MEEQILLFYQRTLLLFKGSREMPPLSTEKLISDIRGKILKFLFSID